MNKAIERILPELHKLRQELHQYPELSGQEEDTALRLESYLHRYRPHKLLVGLGSGTGLAAVYEGAEPGPSLMLRADMDALPIADANHLPYSSQTAGISHKCGHDGHMSMVAGLAPLLHKYPLRRGRVILLMQPAEETGQGAKALLEDKHFRELSPDLIVGLHNLPGYPLGKVVLREGTFCAASKGVKLLLRGSTAHAAEPELGLSPASGLAQLLLHLPQLPAQLPVQELCLLTLTHVRMGEASFGISPGEGELLTTLRAHLQQDLDLLSEAVIHLAQQLAIDNNLGLEISEHEVFPATSNSSETYALLTKAAAAAGLEVYQKPEPFRWSEDFGYYQQLAPSAFFGLGAGLEQPNLHNAQYDFPDALIPYGLRMYCSLIEEVLGVRQS